jgi:hypothetical protein
MATDRREGSKGMIDNIAMLRRLLATVVIAGLAGCGSRDAQYVNFRDVPRSGWTSGGSQSAAIVDAPATSPADGVNPLEATATPGASAETGDSPGSTAAGAAASMNADNSGATGGKSSALLTPGPTIVSPVTGLSGPADRPLIDNSVPAEPRAIELLVPYKHFRRERGTQAVRVSYDDIDLLKILNMEPVPPNARDYFPDWLNKLDGKPVRIRGFMYPVHFSTGITTFTLARDTDICCFTKNPKVYDVILVKLDEGESTDYIDREAFDVEGTFQIDATPDETELPRLYRIENARILH